MYFHRTCKQIIGIIIIIIIIRIYAYRHQLVYITTNVSLIITNCTSCVINTMLLIKLSAETEIARRMFIYAVPTVWNSLSCVTINSPVIPSINHLNYRELRTENCHHF